MPFAALESRVRQVFKVLQLQWGEPGRSHLDSSLATHFIHDSEPNGSAADEKQGGCGGDLK